MSRFLQLHLLTFVPPANLNRDDTGRPKTATIGGTTRLRLSSQALKRAWRDSDIFKTALAGHMGRRTQRFGEDIHKYLLANGLADKQALDIARQVAEVFGKLKKIEDKAPAQIEQLAFISPEEQQAALALAARLAAGEKLKVEPSELLKGVDTAADIALFGRMLADHPDFNRDAAAQVAHAITTHRVTVEDDYYTAVDDLKTRADDAGAGFLGEAGFGSGIFYLYLCINRTLLTENLGGDAALANTAIAALVEAAATVSPRGKQNSFAAFGRASYILAERGDQQPRTLAGAFAKAISDPDLMKASINALTGFRCMLDKAYGASSDDSREMTVGGAGSLADIIAFSRGDAACPAS